MRIAVDRAFTQVTPQHTLTSAMQILGALVAIGWAYILCAYSEEASALSLEDFFKSRVRRASGDYGLQEVKYVPVVGGRALGASLSRCARVSQSTKPSVP